MVYYHREHVELATLLSCHDISGVCEDGSSFEKCSRARPSPGMGRAKKKDQGQLVICYVGFFIKPVRFMCLHYLSCVQQRKSILNMAVVRKKRLSQ